MPKSIKIRNPWLLTGAACLALAPVLYLASGYLAGPRLPADWRWESDFVGIGTNADPATKAFPKRDTPALYERRLAVVGTPQDGKTVRMRDSYVTRNPATGDKIYEYIYEADVDPHTGANLNAESRGDAFVFPRHVQKRPYSLRHSYLKGIPVQYRGEEELEGMSTYVFAYEGRGEYTESYAGTAEFPGVSVAPGQEIRCAEDQFQFSVWVEPVTGEALKVQESCTSGDFIYDKNTGRAIEPIMLWSGESVGQDVIKRVAGIQQERFRILLYTRYLPLATLLLGLACLTAAWRTQARGRWFGA